jgi:hypothetical protein
LPQENTNNSPFGLSGSLDTTLVDAVYYGPLVNYLQYLNNTVYLTYDFRESGTSTAGSKIILSNSVSKNYTTLAIVAYLTGVNVNLEINGTNLLSQYIPNKRSGVVAISTNYNNSTGTASFTAYYGSSSSVYPVSGFPLTFMTSDVPGTRLKFFSNAPRADWTGVHSLVMCSSVHSSTTVSSNLSYLSSRHGVF